MFVHFLAVLWTCSCQFRRLSRWIPRYFTVLQNSMSRPWSRMGRGRLILYFLLKIMTCVLIALSFSPFVSHQLLHAVIYCWPRSLRVERSNPVRIMARSSANAKRCLRVSRSIIKEFSTMFQRTGDKTPPCGAPASIQMMRATPWRFSFSFLVDMKWRIQLLTFPLAFVFKIWVGEGRLVTF